MRARTYDQLEKIWRSGLMRRQVIERLTEIDWPEGITYSMISTIIFESSRVNRTHWHWNACCLDYGDDEEVKSLLGKKDAFLSRHRLYRTITPAELVKGISEELQNYCSHSIFLDTPSKAAEMLSLTEAKQAEEDWTKPFTRIRIVSCDSANNVCNYGLHILHIPKTPWCLISGTVADHQTAEERDMTYTAIAHAFGARKVLHNSAGTAKSNRNHIQMRTGKLGELQGRDASALREILVNEYHVLDGDVMSSRLKGGKGRAMDRNQAEDGPLVRAEKRKRDDKSGLYEKIARQEKDRFNGAGDELEGDVSSEANSGIQHPRDQKLQASKSEAEKKKREREVNELFGQDERLLLQRSESSHSHSNEETFEDLPRIERIKYDLFLPMPEMNGYGEITRAKLRKSPIQLRLDGTHVLAGLRKMVGAGLDGDKFKLSQDNHPSATAMQTTKGLPEWLVDVRGTRVCVGLEEEDNEDDDEEPSIENGEEG
ncbi:hypothetical protein L7F22_009351 [Adiantum nelumboides]|nr:hypothetical protein [Adiantum nelumboides]